MFFNDLRTLVAKQLGVDIESGDVSIFPRDRLAWHRHIVADDLRVGSGRSLLPADYQPERGAVDPVLPRYLFGDDLVQAGEIVAFNLSYDLCWHECSDYSQAVCEAA